MALRKATKQKVKLRVGLAGTSGSGKTFSALLMASGMTSWEKIALIDTENGSGDLYAKLGPYNVNQLTAPFTPEKYIQAIRECEQAGMEVIIIDSITHEWDGEGGLLEVHSKMPGNSFTNWAKITPRHNTFIQAILKSSCHIITTVRKKQDYEMVQDNGKSKPVKVGLKEIQREGFEYELTVNLEIDVAHLATAGKDRTGLFVDLPSFQITPQTGKTLLEWCQDGSEPLPPPTPPVPPKPLVPLKPNPPVVPPKEVPITGITTTYIVSQWNLLAKLNGVADPDRTHKRDEEIFTRFRKESLKDLSESEGQFFLALIRDWLSVSNQNQKNNPTKPNIQS